MTEVKTIKDVSDETWTEFKGLAAHSGVKLGVFFKTLLESYEKKADTFWKDILEGKKILSDKEADEMKTAVLAVRKEYGFRK